MRAVRVWTVPVPTCGDRARARVPGARVRGRLVRVGMLIGVTLGSLVRGHWHFCDLRRSSQA